MKALLSFLLAFWFFGVLFFVNRAKANNCGTEPVIVRPSIAAAGAAIISFEHYSHKPDTSSAFHFLRDSLVRRLKDTDKLKIIGHFTQNEADTDPQIGYKRANSIRTLLDGYIDARQIEIESRLKERTSNAVSFEVLDDMVTQNALDTPTPPMMDVRQDVEVSEKPDEVPPLVDKELPKENIPLVNNNADYIIYFDDKSSNIIGSTAVQQYIDALTKRVKTSKEKIEIIGYDDNNRTKEESLELAKRRTWRVRKAFTDNFVRRKLVQVKNLGQSKPIAPNKTDDGRSKNRRVEIKILKN